MTLSDWTKKLNLPGLKVTDVRGDQFDGKLEDPTACAICGSTHFNVEHKDREKNLIDLLSHQNQLRVIDLHFLYNYYECSNSIKRHFFPRAFVFSNYKRRYTCRFELFIFEHCLVMDAKKLASGNVIHGKISDMDVAEIFAYCTKQLDSLVPKKIAPVQTLYIHRSFIKGTLFYSICNLEDGMLIEILPDCSIASFSTFAERMSLSRLKTVWIDIDDRLLQTIQVVFPNAEICTGKREVQRFIRFQLPLLAAELGADKGIKKAISIESESRSKHSEKRLKAFIEQNPEIAAYYQMEERLGDISKQWTLTQMEEWIDEVPLSSPVLFAIKASLTAYKKQMRNAVGKYYCNKQGNDVIKIAEDHLESIDLSHDKLRKTSAPVMRSRALYGELLLSSFSLEDFCDEQGKFKTQQDVVFEKVVKKCVRTARSGEKEVLLGEPLEEIDARMKEMAESYPARPRVQSKINT